MNSYKYPGKELEIFEEARNWKKYLASRIKPYIKGKVLEVGAGTGETTSYLMNEQVEEWTCLEPDQKLFAALQKRGMNRCKTIQGSLKDLPDEKKFDVIIYIDVLEHIENDREEIRMAALRLNAGGSLIILSPAFQFLYSPFDKAIGHYRRYTKKTLRKIIDVNKLKEIKMFYLEISGMGLLLFNKILLGKKYPSKKIIWTWDGIFILVSRILDRILFYSFGKTIVGIWQKNENSL